MDEPGAEEQKVKLKVIGVNIMKKHFPTWIIITGIILISLLVVLGTPILINELYKNENGYLTMWEAKDMLSYFGMIIAASIGVAGVYFTICVSNKNYREDARKRILPYIAISVINYKLPDPFLEGFNSEDYVNQKASSEITDIFSGVEQNRMFFVIDKNAIRVTKLLSDKEMDKIHGTEVIWKRGRDGLMYIRHSDIISMPFIIENIGNGAATNFCVAFSRTDCKPHFETEVTLKPNETISIQIFSEKNFDDIEGDYIFKVNYEDISGNLYAQTFPVKLYKNGKNKNYKNINISGPQCLIS